ncbi:hypothetical protein AIOGIFDO_00667 [Candidatus Methanoperedenaceae archaeon GB37]|nr:hypothetical protein AIOGIFDO_00667 [Candidatus Methanoperedenaceae archaeon GB37]
MKDSHLYYHKHAITEIKTISYATQLFCQFYLKNRINMERFIEKIKRKNSNTNYTLLEFFNFYNEPSQWSFNSIEKLEKRGPIPVVSLLPEHLPNSLY